MRERLIQRIVLLYCLTVVYGCNQPEGQSNQLPVKLFWQVPADISGISFRNDVVQTELMNYFTNQYVINGGGVAVGDLNNDGLPDLYFTSNQNSNALYLNKGGLMFEDVTKLSGTTGNQYWTTGVSIVDVNADGWNDIYVCHAGNYLGEPEKLKNELFLNNGDANENDGIPTFSEMAEQFGLGGFSRTVQSYFFDYDNDGDLDVYCVNHPYNFWLPIEMRIEGENDPYPDETDNLFRNNGNGTFTDVTEKAGLKNWAFGLSASIADYNNDGWMDIYVCNDYSEKDELYMNNADGSFSKAIDSSMFHISNFSMGSDAADMNNDLLPDLLIVDMMAEDNRRKKINMSAMKPEVFWDNVALGRHYQYMQNTLQLNNGNGSFSEIAELANVAFTDWSWSPFFADLDNDGWKDIFISNGIALDIRNTDANKPQLGKHLLELRKDFRKHLETMPSEPVPNYAFRNNGDLTFSKSGVDWGLDFEGFSSGAIYSDLDRDGDLDIIVNNVDDVAMVFENRLEDSNFIQFELNGSASNPNGIGASVTVCADGKKQLNQVSSARGFQSGVEPVLHFGIGAASVVDSVIVSWQDGLTQTLRQVKPNQLLTLNYSDAKEVGQDSFGNQVTLFDNVNEIDHVHFEIEYDDYEYEVLLPHKYSQLGPFAGAGDVNGDGLTDILVGGSSGNPATLLIQEPSGTFMADNKQPWSQHKEMEDMGVTLFDADQDGDLDAYVCSGSNQWEEGHQNYLDRLYLNNGSGKFVYEEDGLPELYTSSSSAVAHDFDEDGDLDLFVGGRLIPRKYPLPATSRLLLNEGGHFVDATQNVAPGFKDLGMVTSAIWTNIDSDPNLELVLAGEWMELKAFKFENGTFQDVSSDSGLSGKFGWWYSLHTADLDNDGDQDIIAGNLGLNTKYKGTPERPFHVYYRDFDQNGRGDIVLTYEQDEELYTVRGRSCSAEQVPFIKRKFPTYEEFGSATVNDVFGADLDSALHYETNHMETTVFWNDGNGHFSADPLPNQAQFSPVIGIETLDVNGDDLKDIILTGNMYNAETETCRHDASIGSVFLNKGGRSFDFLPVVKSGFATQGDTRGLIKYLGADGEIRLAVFANNAPVQSFRLRDYKQSTDSSGLR